MECKCERCKRACSYNPGWFMPGEAEKAATYLDLSLQEFFDQYLGVNWWEESEETDNDIFLLAPMIIDMQAGREYPGNPEGQCIFFENDLCKIHKVKPYECAEYIHGHNDDIPERHWKVSEAWKEHQTQIEELLGREPKSEPFSGGLLDGLFGF